ncbi:Uncharacterized conserved protein, DUF427 family [Tranquillimonas rosea]|uniref:Uncharacterized conserved protein, DUF427 family n=1 Tax=Tranquillimonas rosea TaxID=641238 RepID=A0A1H9V1L7_9RHOB|nr:DUF427 domain-containing protein [Tranquillimonas rosea]SES15147.1 Uncharacterized conserved protein, DUF427 family [Tranquillimonas rosea]
MADDITIRDSQTTWVVRAGGAVLGESGRAIEVADSEGAVIYFPREDIGVEFLDSSSTRTKDDRKGEATYYSIQTKSTLIPDAAWSYEAPAPEAARLAGHLAFDAEKVTVEEL